MSVWKRVRSRPFTIKAVYQGSKSRYTFHSEEEEAEIGSGSYLLSLDGGETVYFIDGNDNSCRQWSNEKLVQSLSGFLLATTDKFNVESTNVEVHKVFEKNVADMHGLPVKHIQINISFTASYKYMLFKDKYEIERIADFWVTPKLEGIDAQPIFSENR